jgi:hypothetical protein
MSVGCAALAAHALDKIRERVMAIGFKCMIFLPIVWEDLAVL